MGSKMKHAKSSLNLTETVFCLSSRICSPLCLAADHWAEKDNRMLLPSSTDRQTGQTAQSLVHLVCTFLLRFLILSLPYGPWSIMVPPHQSVGTTKYFRWRPTAVAFSGSTKSELTLSLLVEGMESVMASTAGH